MSIKEINPSEVDTDDMPDAIKVKEVRDAMKVKTALDVIQRTSPRRICGKCKNLLPSLHG